MRLLMLLLANALVLLLLLLLLMLMLMLMLMLTPGLGMTNAAADRAGPQVPIQQAGAVDGERFWC